LEVWSSRFAQRWVNVSAWGSGSFENDDASDWLYALEADGVDQVRAALVAIGDEGNVDAVDAARAIAAAELIAAIRDAPMAGMPEEGAVFAAAHASSMTDDDVAEAVRALGRVLSKESELAVLWTEADDPDWRTRTAGIVRRLQG
jgi:hypothetical protein